MSQKEYSGDSDRNWLDLSASLAVVIGGGDGIGAAIARGLASTGCELVLCGRNRDKLNSVQAAIAESGARTAVRIADVRDPSSITELAADIHDAFGVPQILVNSMGGMIQRRAFDVTPDEWDLIHETHLRGTFLSCQAFASMMAGQGYGKIVNLSSTFAYTVMADGVVSTYAIAKAGISHLTSVLAVEWAGLGVRVNALAPTSTKTPRVESFYAENPEVEQAITSRIPLGRLAEPDDIVGPAIFLASRMSDFVTGLTLLVDGGWTPAK